MSTRTCREICRNVSTCPPRGTSRVSKFSRVSAGSHESFGYLEDISDTVVSKCRSIICLDTWKIKTKFFVIDVNCKTLITKSFSFSHFTNIGRALRSSSSSSSRTAVEISDTSFMMNSQHKRQLSVQWSTCTIWNTLQTADSWFAVQTLFGPVNIFFAHVQILLPVKCHIWIFLSYFLQCSLHVNLDIDLVKGLQVGVMFLTSYVCSLNVRE